MHEGGGRSVGSNKVVEPKKDFYHIWKLDLLTNVKTALLKNKNKTAP